LVLAFAKMVWLLPKAITTPFLLVGFGFSQNGVVIAEGDNHTIFT
jgi:hypothetical protein